MDKNETDMIIKCLEKGNLLTNELRDTLYKHEDIDDSTITFDEVHHIDELDILKNYQIESIYESETEVTVKVKETNFVLSRKLPDGRRKYCDLIISHNGDRYLSEEHD